jgi:hypothetical protein
VTFGGAPAIVEALREFLEDGTHGGTGSPAATLNGTIATARTDLSIVDGDGADGTPVTFPDVKAFHPWLSPGASGSEFPHLGIEWVSHDGENDPHSGRGFTHQLRLVTYVPVSVVATTAARDEAQAAMYAVSLYDLALSTLFLRDASTGLAQGKSLNAGGTGRAQNKIRRAVLTGSNVSISGDPGSPALVLITDLSVTISEPYRA